MSRGPGGTALIPFTPPSNTQVRTCYLCGTRHEADSTTGLGYDRRMLQEMHYVLASPESIPKYPAKWGLPPKIPNELRQQVPFASGSYLWCLKDPSFYQACGFSESRPGWTVTLDGTETAVRAGPVNWNAQVLKNSTSIDDAAAQLGWTVLRQHNLPSVAAQHSEVVQRRLEQMTHAAATTIQVNPTSPGVLTMDIEQNKFWCTRPSWVLDAEQEPIGLLKGESIAIFTRHHFRDPGCINVLYNNGLTEANVDDFAALMDKVSKDTNTKMVRVWDLDPTGAVATRLQQVKPEHPSILQVPQGFLNWKLIQPFACNGFRHHKQHNQAWSGQQ